LERAHFVILSFALIVKREHILLKDVL